MKMNTVYSITPDRQEHYATVRAEKLAETIKRLKNRGHLNIKVIK